MVITKRKVDGFRDKNHSVVQFEKKIKDQFVEKNYHYSTILLYF